jgi:hypothetical protein
MGIEWRGGDSREEDKEEGVGLGEGIDFFCWKEKEKPEKGKGSKILERRKDAKFLCGFLLVDCCCWDFGLGGQEI